MTEVKVSPRVAAAPISWGVIEVDNWGIQLAPDRVLQEMRQLGITMTEFGPEGFLPADPQEKAHLLAELGLQAIGGFVPVLLHDALHDPLPEVERELEAYVAAGATRLVLAASTGLAGYDTRPELDEAGWATLLGNLDRLREAAAARGITAVIHPHAGTMVETPDDLARVLDGCAIGLCFDTGHLLIGGSDPVALVVENAARVEHVHLKDVRVAVANQVRSGELSYRDAVLAGLYAPLGEGDIDIAAIIRALEAVGYDGYYVLEQDTVVEAVPAEGTGPIESVRTSIRFVMDAISGS